VPSRRIKKAKINFISLVPKGASKMPVIYKDDDAFEVKALTKSITDEGELTSIVYPADREDSQGELASAEVIKEMAHEFARDGLGAVDIRHDGKALSKEQAYVAESFLVPEGDPRFKGLVDYDGEPVNPTGAWAVVVKIEDEDLRQKYRSGEWKGVSMGGVGVFEEVGKERRNSIRAATERLMELLGMSNGSAYANVSLAGEIDMTKEELIAAQKEANESLAKTIIDGVGEAVAKAMKPEDGAGKDAGKTDKPEDTGPVFKGDLDDEKAVRKFEYDRRLWEIRKDVDYTDPISVSDAKDRVSELKKEFTDLFEKKGETGPSPSNAPDEDDETGDGFGFRGISKSEQIAAETGEKMAGWINKRRGFAVN